MTTYNTGNPIGSTDSRDRLDNTENFDVALNTLEPTWDDRFGRTRDSYEGALSGLSFYRVGTFAAGYTLTNMRQTLEHDGHEYSWAGTFPKVVPAGATPATSGGVGAGAWVDRTDWALRSDLLSGALKQRFADRFALRDFVSVLDFYIIEDGSDYSAATQRAIDSLKGVGGTVYIPNKGSDYYFSSGVGTDPSISDDLADNISIVGDTGVTIVLSETANTHAICLEGSNVSVRRLTVTSERSIDYSAELAPQRAVYQVGIVVGGKGYTQSPRSLGSLSDFKSGARVEDCIITNMNAPIIAFRAEKVTIARNTVDQYTDTGILIDDCTTDVDVLFNKVTRGGDDNIFIRHYNNSPWAIAQKYIGRYVVLRNNCSLTFGKNCGAGGISDLLIAENILDMSWAGALNLEADDWAQTSTEYNRNVLIIDNIVLRAGRNYNTTEQVASHQSAYPDLDQCAGFHSKYRNTRVGQFFKNVEFKNNTVINPRAYGVHSCAIDAVSIEDNTFIAGYYDHGAGNGASSGAAIKAQNGDNIVAASNRILGDNVNFHYCYELIGATLLNNVRIANNHEQYGISVMLADTKAKASGVVYISQQAGSIKGEHRSDGNDDRFSYIGTGKGGNIHVYHAENWPTRIYNGSGTGLVLGVDSAGTNIDNVGIGITQVPGRKLHICGTVSGVPAIRVDNSNVNNGSVNVTLGALGPTGARESVQGWLAIDIGGVTRYMPFW